MKRLRCICCLALAILMTMATTSCVVSSTDSAQAIATMGKHGISVAYLADYVICVALIPTDSAIAGQRYWANLHENGRLRESRPVSFNQPEINIHTEKTVYFHATRDEFSAYQGRNISEIFTCDVIE